MAAASVTHATFIMKTSYEKLHLRTCAHTLLAHHPTYPLAHSQNSVCDTEAPTRPVNQIRELGSKERETERERQRERE